jgi:PAS domain S-box-containing protein
MADPITPNLAFRKVVAALRESDERYRRLVEGIRRYAILMFDREGIILTWNQGIETLLGYSREDIIGKSVSILYTAKQRAAEAPELEMATTVRTGESDGVRVSVRKDGAEVVGHDTTTALCTTSGEVFGFAKVIRPLSEADSKTASELARALAALHIETEHRQRLEVALLTAVEAERQRLGQDLHDDLSQRLTGISLMTRALAKEIDGKEPRLGRKLQEISKLLSDANECARSLARGLHPVTLAAQGLPAALEELASRVPVDVTFRWPTSERLDLEEPVALHLYRIAEEAVGNALKHSGANRITIKIDTPREGAPALVISDNGRGFDPAGEKGAGMGLRNMQYRADAIHAVLTVESKPNRGTDIRCTIPSRRAKRSRPARSAKRRSK